MLLAVAFIGCDQQESTATPQAPAASAEQPAAQPAEPAASAEQPAAQPAEPTVSAEQPVAQPTEPKASDKMSEAAEAAKAAAAKTGEAAQIVVADASDKARETAAAASAKAGEALDLAGQAASDIATDLKKGASEALDNFGVAVDKAGESAREVGAKAADKTGKALSSAADKAKGLADDWRPSDEPSSGGGLTMAFLAHQKFTLKKVNGADYHGQQTPFIEFGDNAMVSGKVCNTFRGPGQLAGSVLTVQSMISTKMLCPVDGLDELETRFFSMLEQGAEISMNSSQLSFKQGGTVLVFEANTSVGE